MLSYQQERYQITRTMRAYERKQPWYERNLQGIQLAILAVVSAGVLLAGASAAMGI